MVNWSEVLSPTLNPRVRKTEIERFSPFRAPSVDREIEESKRERKGSIKDLLLRGGKAREDQDSQGEAGWGSIAILGALAVGAFVLSNWVLPWLSGRTRGLPSAAQNPAGSYGADQGIRAGHGTSPNPSEDAESERAQPASDEIPLLQRLYWGE